MTTPRGLHNRRHSTVLAGAALALLAAAPASQGPPWQRGATIERVAACGGFLEGPNVDADGHLWVVDYLTGNILTVRDGRCSIAATTGGAANGARFGSDGRLYIADAKRGLMRFDPATGTVTPWIDQLDGEPLLGANDLAFDSAGNLYLTVRGTATYLEPTGRVIVIPAGSDTPRVIASGLRFPNGIAVTPEGTLLFIGLFAEKTILAIRLDPESHAPQLSYVFARTAGGIGPDGMILDSQGRLTWADFGGGTITSADSAAHMLGSLRLPDAAGPGVTNMVRHDGALYITEAERGEIWRVPLADAAD